jgi:hypothetical protein
VLGRSGECPKQSPQEGGSFLEREQERGKEMRFFSVWRRSPVCLTYSSRVRPTCARHARTVRDAPADSPRGTRTIRHPGADDLLLSPEPPILPGAPSTRADGPRRTDGQSARNCRTVRPTAADGPSLPFFSA